jgi:hypothetical protein
MHLGKSTAQDRPGSTIERLFDSKPIFKKTANQKNHSLSAKERPYAERKATMNYSHGWQGNPTDRRQTEKGTH